MKWLACSKKHYPSLAKTTDLITTSRKPFNAPIVRENAHLISKFLTLRIVPAACSLEGSLYWSTLTPNQHPQCLISPVVTSPLHRGTTAHYLPRFEFTHSLRQRANNKKWKRDVALYNKISQTPLKAELIMMEKTEHR
jgi:hypothetical protein